jgi:hypothetical protein
MVVVRSRDDFVRFVAELRDDLLVQPEDWENGTLERFLEALAAWVHDMDAYYTDNGLKPPVKLNWQFMADMILAAKHYE